MTQYLSRARLRRDAAVDALAALLVPPAMGARVGAAHRLVWALFADGSEQPRDFLWREEGPGQFMMLSARPPVDPHGLFELDSQPFEPALAPGDRLGFRLRANPVVARRVEPGKRSKPHDVVMDALYRLPKSDRAAARRDVVERAGRSWLAAQGERHGFVPAASVAIDGYQQVRVPRHKEKDAEFAVLDFEGHLVVADPALFLARLSQGFGRAKGFGYGLMLIRRAPVA